MSSAVILPAVRVASSLKSRTKPSEPLTAAVPLIAASTSSVLNHRPETSVVDENLRVHECPNLYLCGSEVFVTGGAMQPCLTIVALAHRLADHLGERLAGEAGP